MKNILSIALLGLFAITTATAQSTTNKSGTQNPVFSIEAFSAPIQQTGQNNYLVSLSGRDLKNMKYCFYTDNNGTVAYVKLDGKIIKATGGENAEHILAYVGMGYTVTLSLDKASSVKDVSGVITSKANLTIYDSNGKVMGTNVVVLQK